MGGVGTVAYRDGDRIWAFGHPFDGLGARGLFLQDAFVHTVVNNPVGALRPRHATSSRAPGNAVGSIFTDGISAVAGRIGPLPERTPPDRPGRRTPTAAPRRSRRREIANEASIGLPGNVSSIVPFAVGDAELGGRARSRRRHVGTDVPRAAGCASGSAPLQLCNRYFGDRLIPGAVQGEMAVDAEVATALVDELASRRDDPPRLGACGHRAAARRTAARARASVRGPKRVRRGQTIRVRVTAQRAARRRRDDLAAGPGARAG